jgi:putative endopeptidase
MKKITVLSMVSVCTLTGFLLNSCEHNSDTRVANDPVYTDRDTTVKPGDDFFSYANGGWLKKNPIPSAYASWGIGNVVEEDLRNKLKKINEDALTANAPKGSNTQKIGDFYFSGMDTVDIEKEGLSPLNPELDKIAAVNDINSLINEFAHLHTIGVTTPLGCYAGQDAKNSAKIIMQLGQDGIGLPDRDYYFNTDEHSVAIRNDYQKKHLPTLFKLSGMTDAAAASATAKTYALEKSLADSSRKLEDLRDPYHNYNKMTVAGLEKLTPLIDWKTAFEKMDYKGVDTVIVGQPEYFRAFNKALATYSIADWKNYLVKNLVSSYSSELSKPFELEDFRFSAIFTGSKVQLPRCKRVIDAENGLMGEVLGQIFVKEYFPEKTKKRYVDLVENMRASFKEHIEKLDWMSDATKEKAYYKLSKVIPKVGYPDKWKDFSTLTIDRGPYVLNVMRANNYWHLFEANKLGKPVDRTEWDITPANL